MSEEKKKGWCFSDWIFRKQTPVRTCPHCGMTMDENEMMKHVSLCYSSSFSATNGEYRGSVTQLSGTVKQFENGFNRNSSKSVNRNERPDSNMSTVKDSYTKIQKSTD